MTWKLVNSSSDGFLFQTWICTNSQLKCCILVPQPCYFYCLSVVICKQSGKRFCFPALEEREVLMEFLLGFLQMQPNRRVCYGEREWRRVSFHLRCCTVALVLLSYLCETPTNFIYIFIRCRQGWHICVRRPHVYR